MKDRDWPKPQMTQEQAIEFHNIGAWEHLTPIERGAFQLRQQYLAMPFGKFHEGLEALLGRPVFTHELGLNYDGILAEAEGRKDAPSMADIIGLIPDEKRVVISF